jgi:hypothetical protein
MGTGCQFAHHGKRTTYFHSQPNGAGFDQDLPFKINKNLNSNNFGTKISSPRICEFYSMYAHFNTFLKENNSFNFMM